MKKTLIAYYSAENHTKEIAQKLADYTNADLFEITPKEVYTSEDLDWTNENSRVTREYHDKNLRNVELKENMPENFDSYDRVIIAYPIWWGIAAWPVNTFMKNNDFAGKNIVMVATSYSSNIGDSDKLLMEDARGGNLVKSIRFYQDADDDEIKKFADEL